MIVLQGMVRPHHNQCLAKLGRINLDPGIFKSFASLHCPIANSTSTQSQQLRARGNIQATVSHPSTNQAQRYFTSVIVRELVFPRY